MKRSHINALIDSAKELLARRGICLPPFAYWNPADWKDKGPECDEIRRCRLGWDVTDFGSDNFERIGLVVFTLRNGHRTLAPYSNKTYCEKLLLVGENQLTPMHYHVFKQEDIICRNGGDLVCKVNNKHADGTLADTDVEISLDGVRRRVKAGTEFVLRPGESITLTPFIYHEFWARAGTGTSIVGEVSKVNDDATDNFFLNSSGRYPKIDEDEAPTHLLCTDYACP